MGWISDNSVSSVIHKKTLEIGNCIIKCVDFAIKKRFFINLIIFLLSIALITGFYCSIDDKEYWEKTIKIVTNKTNDKFMLIGNNFVDKAQIKFETSILLAYNNSKNAINEKRFHQFPKVNIRSKTNIIENFSKKSFNTIDESKKLRLGEFKWKLFSKFQ